MIPTIIAYDYSGSTAKNKFYHQKTQEVVNQESNPVILRWNGYCIRITRGELDRINRTLEGAGGTHSDSYDDGK